jgi:hypothetical protein
MNLDVESWSLLIHMQDVSAPRGRGAHGAAFKLQGVFLTIATKVCGDAERTQGLQRFLLSRGRKGLQTARLSQDTNRKTALSTREVNVRGDERVAVFVSVRAAEGGPSRHTGPSCRKRISEQPKQGGLNWRFTRIHIFFPNGATASSTPFSARPLEC